MLIEKEGLHKTQEHESNYNLLPINMYKFVSSITSKVSKIFTQKTSEDEADSNRPASDSKSSISSSSSLQTRHAEISQRKSTTTANANASTISCDKQQTNRSKKRNRLDGYYTPMLVHPHSNEFDSDHDESALLSGVSKKKKLAGVMGQSNSLLLEMIPHEVLEANVFSFLTEGRDFHSLQLTCREMKSLSDKLEILRNVDLSGDAESGKGSILNHVESPVVAVGRLYKFAAAGNQQALYMYVWCGLYFCCCFFFLHFLRN